MIIDKVERINFIFIVTLSLLVLSLAGRQIVEVSKGDCHSGHDPESMFITIC